MSFVRLTRDGQTLRRRRGLINGDPNCGKTTSLLTAPRPIAIMSYPGEKGYDSIPTDDPEIIPLIWTQEKKQPSALIVKEVFDLSTEVVAGKFGKINTFAGDGLHKLIDYILDDVTDGAWLGGLEFEPKLYGLAYRALKEYLSRVCHTNIPVVLFTSWSEDEADRKKKPGEKATDVPTHVLPQLPGRLAKEIMGEFSVVVHQSIGLLTPKDSQPVRRWQTRPFGQVWGASLKGPQKIVDKIPTFIKADYRELERVWEEAEKA